MVLRDLLEWRPTAFHHHWVLQERHCADDQRRGEFRLSQLLDAVGCDPRGVPLRFNENVRVMSVVRIKKATRLFRVTGRLQTLRMNEDSLDRFRGVKGCDRLEVVCN